MFRADGFCLMAQEFRKVIKTIKHFGQKFKVLYVLAANSVQRLTFMCVPCITSTQPQHRVAVYGSFSDTDLLQAALHCINHMLLWRGLQTSLKLSIIVEYFAIVRES